MSIADYRASGRLIAIAITTVCAMQIGCNRHQTDLSTPRTAYEAFRACVGNGDWEGVFPLLIPEVKDNITKTWTMNRKTAQLIETSVPPALKQNFLAEIGPAEVRELAARLDVSPTKKLGQNFVIDPNTVRKIVRLAGTPGMNPGSLM